MASSSRIATKQPPPPKSKSPESFHSIARREMAAQVLQSYEKLSWWSFQRCESMVQTRLHFQNIVAGYTSEDEATYIDWKEDFTRHPLKPGEEPKQSRKGKERVSSGAHRDVGAAGRAEGSGSGGDGGKGKGREKCDSGSASQVSKKKRKSGGETRGY